MKHSLPVTALLVGLFVASQLIGLALLSIAGNVTTENGHTVVQYNDTALGPRPQTEGFSSLLYIIIGVGIGTGLVMLIIKFGVFKLWKAWFFIAVWFSTTIAFGVIIPTTIALILCLLLAAWKVFWPNPIIHNLTEIFMYAGLVVLLAPIFTLIWAIVLLLIISVYDIIAVWYSKHMVVMAQAQTKSNLFAGLYIPRKEQPMATAAPTAEKAHTAAHTAPHVSEKTVPAHKIDAKLLEDTPAPANHSGSAGAILGGGDIAFPLLFSGVVMDWLITQGTSKTGALYESLIIVATTTIALALLFFYAKKDKFYPAMPFISAGCFAGFGIIMLIRVF